MSSNQYHPVSQSENGTKDISALFASRYSQHHNKKKCWVKCVAVLLLLSSVMIGIMAVGWTVLPPVNLKIIRYKLDRTAEMLTDSVPATFKSIQSTITSSRNHSIYVHFHIPKTGGQRLFTLIDPKGINCGAPDRCCSGHSDKTLQKIAQGGECKNSFFSYEMTYQQVTRYLSKDIKEGRVKVLTMMREPMSYFQSSVEHMIRQGECDSLEQYEQGGCPKWNLTNKQTFFIGAGDLERAKQAISEEIFFVGLTDYYDASLCLLMYQLGVFDADACSCGTSPVDSNKGGSTAGGAARVHLKPYNANPRSGGGAGGAVGPLLAPGTGGRAYAEAHTAGDRALYAAALGLFRRRAREVEAETGARVLCEGEGRRRRRR